MRYFNISYYILNSLLNKYIKIIYIILKKNIIEEFNSFENLLKLISD